ncbi:hypothetical protein C0991_007677 [Blastosporella zonata]|nr:hypothetical protein C0991_007677 [Blastosporella zonata]
MNHMLSRGGSTSDFGMNSMFESTRQRKALADEDAPPTNSVNDIPNELNFTSSPHFRASASTSTRSFADDVPLFARAPQRTPPQAHTQQQQQQPIYIIIFGYPPEKYSSTVDFFQGLGATTDPDPHLEIQNCFRIGFTDAGEASRAVRRNGEVLGGSWMIGVKWADPAQAEAILSQLKSQARAAEILDSSSSNAMAVDEPIAHVPSSSPHKGAQTPNGVKGGGGAGVGFGGMFNTPGKVAPARAALRKHNPDVRAAATPQPQRGWGSINTPVAPTQPQPLQQAPRTDTSSPSKGVLGQVSDLIFGW